MLNADAAPVEVLVVDAGDSANDGQADTFQVDQADGSLRVSVNGQQVYEGVPGAGAELHIRGSSDQDVLVADLFAGARLVFDGGDGDDQLLLSSRQDAARVSYDFASTSLATIELQDASGSASIGLRGVELITDTVAAAERGVSIHGTATGATLARGDTGGFTRAVIQGESAATLEFLNPSEVLRLDSGGAVNDTPRHFAIEGLGDGFQAGLDVVGAPTDTLTILGDVRVGEAGLHAHVGSVEIAGALSVDAGELRLDADQSVRVTATGALSSNGGPVSIAAPRIEVAGAISSPGGSIMLDSGPGGTTLLTGLLDASQPSAGGRGGSIHVLGDFVDLGAGARIEAFGAAAGGEVLVGGGRQGADPTVRNAVTTRVDQGVVVRADALAAGMGGVVVFWSDAATRFHGTATARGGVLGGDGGFVEVSGKQALVFTGWADAAAPAGMAGTVLLDPTDIVVHDAADLAQDDDAELPDVSGVAGALNISETALEALAANSNIILSATNNITINDLADDTLGLLTTGAGSITIIADSDGMDGGSVVMVDANDAIQTAGASLSISGAQMSLGAIDTGGGDLTIENTDAATIAGIISGAGALVKNGAGTLTLTASNTYTGATTINEGRLEVDGSLAAGSAVSVAGGELGGSGTVNGQVSMTAAGGAVSPGTTVGLLTVNNNVSLNGAGSFVVDLNGTTPGTGHDQLSVTGANRTVNLSGATLDVNLGAGLSDGDTFVIIDNDEATSSIMNTFDGLADGDQVGALPLTINYNAGADNNDVVLTFHATQTIDGQANADEFLVDLHNGNLRVQLDGSVVLEAPAGDVSALTINGLNGSDTLTVDHSGGFVDVDIVFNGGGGGGSDTLVVRGDGADNATYTPGAAGAGAVVVDDDGGGQMTITFSGLEPVDLTGMATATLMTAGGVDALTITNGLDGGTGLIDALVVSGTSGGVAIESAHFFGNTSVVIDTTTVDAADTITIASASNSHLNSNLTLNTGAGADVINFAGSVSLTGAMTITSAAADVNDGPAEAAVDIFAASLTVTAASFGDAGAPIQTTVGTLSVDTSASGGAQFVVETDGLTAINLNAGAGNVTLTTGGAVTDTDAAVDVVAANASLTIGGAFGAAANRIGTDVGSLTVNSSAAGGAQFITESNGLTALDLNAGAGSVTLTTGAAVADTDVAVDIQAANADLTVAGALGAAANRIGTTVGSLTVNTSATGGDQFITETNGLTAINLNAGAGDVSLTAGGTIADADGSTDVTAGNLSLQATGAGAAIGANANPINVTLAGSLTALATTGAGGIFIHESNAMLAGAINAGAGNVVLSADGDLSTTDSQDIIGENITLTLTANHTLTVDDNTSIIGDSDLNGSGDVTLVADKMTLASSAGDLISAGSAGTLLIRAVESGTLMRIGSTAGADTDAGAGTLALDSVDLAALDPTSGTFQFGAPSARGPIAITNGGATLSIDTRLAFVATTLTFENAGDALQTTSDVVIDATGAITDAAGADVVADISAATLRINSATTIGVSEADALNLSVGRLIVDASNGDAFFTEANGLALGTVDVTTGDLFIRAFAGSIIDATSSVIANDLTLRVDELNAAIGAAATPINLTLSGTLTALATNGTGGVFLTESNEMRVAIVSAAGGNVELAAISGSLVSASPDMIADVFGAFVTLVATAGDIGAAGASLDVSVATQLDADTSGANGDIFIDSIGDLPLGLVTAGTGNVTVAALDNPFTLPTEGAITDADAGAGLDIVATSATLSALNGIGAGTGDLAEAEAIDVNVVTLNASNTIAGAIQITDTNNFAIGVVANPGRVVVLDAIGQMTDGNGAALNVTAGDAILRAGSGVGAAVDPLETSFTRLEAAGGLGGFFLTNDRSLQIDDVSAVLNGAFAGVTADADIVVTADDANAVTTEDLTINQQVVSRDQSATVNAQGGIAVNALVMGAQDVDANANANLTSVAPITATNGSAALDAGGAVDLGASVSAGQNLSVTAGQNLATGAAATLTSGNGSAMLDAGANVSLGGDVSAVNGLVSISAGNAALNAIVLASGVQLRSVGGTISDDALAIVGGRFTALDLSMVNIASPPLTNGSTALLDAELLEASLGGNIQIQIDWREQGGDVSNAAAFGGVGVADVLAGAPDSNDRIVADLLPTAPYANTYQHTYDANPDGATAAQLNVVVRISQFAGGAIVLNVGGSNLLDFQQATGTLGGNLPGGTMVDLDGDGTVDAQQGIMAVVQFATLEFLVAQSLPIPEALPAAPPLLTSPPTPPPPATPVTQIATAAPAGNTPGVTTQAEVRYYELRVVSFDADGNLVEASQERINLNDPRLQAITPFNPSKLPQLFKLLPGDRYRIYLHEDGADRLMIEFVIERVGDEGRPIELPDRIEADNPEARNQPGPSTGAEARTSGVTRGVPNDAPRAATDAPRAAIDDGAVSGRSDHGASFAESLGSANFAASGGVVFGAALFSHAAQRRARERAHQRMAAFGRGWPTPASARVTPSQQSF